MQSMAYAMRTKDQGFTQGTHDIRLWLIHLLRGLPYAPSCGQRRRDALRGYLTLSCDTCPADRDGAPPSFLGWRTEGCSPPDAGMGIFDRRSEPHDSWSWRMPGLRGAPPCTACDCNGRSIRPFAGHTTSGLMLMPNLAQKPGAESTSSWYGPTKFFDSVRTGELRSHTKRDIDGQGSGKNSGLLWRDIRAIYRRTPSIGRAGLLRPATTYPSLAQ
jgi:hypothetical protein